MRILAHRGSPGSTRVENTIPAISAALEAGADGVEVDIRLTADGVLAACHDPDLRRLTGVPLAVATTSWSVLRDAADLAATPLARVEWVLAAAAGRSVILELKPGPTPREQTVAALITRLAGLHAAGLPMSLTVSSFDPILVAAVRAAAPRELGLRTALLGDVGCLPLATLRQALDFGHDEVHPHISDLLTCPEVVASARACGVTMIPWTVNSRRSIRRCADLGVEAVITDVPQTARLSASRRTAA